LNIRLLRSEDVETLLLIQDECPESAAWTQSSLESAARGEDMAGWAAESGSGKICGFLLARVTSGEPSGEMEILNLAVLPASRRRGAGSLLLDTALTWGISQGAATCFLELRISNMAAHAFYSEKGFVDAGARPNYYQNPPEDARLMALTML
jgi:ribosomal-protein-alanine N-acetyltransferase